MRISLENVGAVKFIEFDLSKNLHVIFGQNNVGKSYSITVLYLILKNLLDLNLIQSGFTPSLSMKEQLEKITIPMIEGDEKIDVTSQFSETVAIILNAQFTPLTENSIINTFGSIDNLRRRSQGCIFDFKIGLHFDFQDHVLSTGVSDIFIENKGHSNSLIVSSVQFYKKYKIKKANNSRGEKPRTTHMTPREVCFFMSDLDKDVSIKFFDYSGTIVSNLLRDIGHTVADVHFLPASRSGLYQSLGAFGAIVAELAKSRAFIRKKIELPSLSEPVSNYFISLSNVNTQLSDSDKNSFASKIADKIETDILGGVINFNDDSKKITYSPQNSDLKLDLSLTSSMVSELSPIVTYLRYILSREHTWLITSKHEKIIEPLIFIEEPEAHLHPEVQVKMTKIFAELAANHFKVIMTTHSNYMLSELNNLIMDKGLELSNFSAYLMGREVDGCFSRLMDVDKYGIDDINFAKVSDDLMAEQDRIIDKINAGEV